MVSSLSIIALVIAVVLGYLAQQEHSPPPFSTKPCTDDAPLNVSLDATMMEEGWISPDLSIDPCHVFSETYSEARHKFRQAAAAAGAERHRLPVDIPARLRVDGLLDDDDDDNQYTIDIAVLRGSKPGLAVHTSGVHGVEGYAGSSVQIAFLETVYPALTSRELPTIVLIHAVNPFGMAHSRRANENNVDLNRNGLHLEDWKEIDTESAGDPTGPYAAYEKFQPFFNPAGRPTWLYAMVSLLLRMVHGVTLYGFDALKSGMVTGQYYEPKGIFYGGNELQPSLQLLWDFFHDTLLVSPSESSDATTSNVDEESESEETVSDQQETTEDTTIRTSRRCCTGPVTWIDVHTGLGSSGIDSFLVDAKTMPMLEHEVPLWFPGAQTPQLSKHAKEVLKGYDNAKGFTASLFRPLFEGRQLETYLSVAQEFGTVPGVMVAHALIVENRAFHYIPSRQEALDWAKRTTKRAFYKQTPTWRRQILNRGMQLWLQAIRRSSHPLSSSNDGGAATSPS